MNNCEVWLLLYRKNIPKYFDLERRAREVEGLIKTCKKHLPAQPEITCCGVGANYVGINVHKSALLCLQYIVISINWTTGAGPNTSVLA